jgi:hypothetical protein
MEGAKQSTPDLLKIWIVTPDGRERESHALMESYPSIELNENFAIFNPEEGGTSYGEFPGDPNLPAYEVINCRCAVGYAYKQREETQPHQEIIQNPLYPDKIAGVSRGEEMTRDEANHGKPNPNLLIGKGYQTNCQSCVVVYEARLRGYDVQTLPNTKGSTLQKLSRDTNLAWIDPKTGLNPNYIFDDKANTPQRLFKFIEETVKKEERYTIEFSWKGKIKEGHILSLDRDNSGKLRLYDPQSGKSTTNEKNIIGYFSKFKLTQSVYGRKYSNPAKLIRIDDKLFNTVIINNIMEGTKK